MAIDIDDLTDNIAIDSSSGEVTGDGILDKLMITATKHLTAQYKAGRIRGEDFAKAYAQIYLATLQASEDILIKKLLVDAQVKTETAKEYLYLRQSKAFDDEYKKNIFKICLDNWAVYASLASSALESDALPNAITAPILNKMFNDFIGTDLDSNSSSIIEGTGTTATTISNANNTVSWADVQATTTTDTSTSDSSNTSSS